MRNPITKAIRHIKRDVDPQVTWGAGGVGAGVGALAVATVATGGAAIVIAPFVLFGAFAGVIAMDYERPKKVKGNSLKLNGYKMIGDNDVLTSIRMMQYLIDKKTSKMQHLQTLPEKFMAPYIKDAAEALQKVRVYKDDKQVSPDSFSFVRTFYDENGVSQTQKIPVVREDAIQPKKGTDGARLFQPMPPAATVVPEFSALAKRVEKIEAELKPQQLVLDKPAPKKAAPKP